jgi:uncharacterized protein YacL
MLDIIQTLLLIGVIILLIWRNSKSAKTEKPGRKIILDSCALIDGRIVDIINAGFTPAIIVVPKFVLGELQLLADGHDSQKRERARYGLDAVKTIQASPDTQVDISEINFPEVRTIDEKLVKLAVKLDAELCTTDYNLNKVASIQNVRVLNVNELSNALRAVVLPGEKKQITIVQKGSAKDQGVGYLDDGTMVVVAGASSQIGRNLTVEITRMLQSDAGKMLFGNAVFPKEKHPPKTQRRNNRQPKAQN